MADQKIQPLRAADTKLMFCSGKECSFFLDADGWERNVTGCARGPEEAMQEPGSVCPWFYVERVKELEDEIKGMHEDAAGASI